MTMQAWKRYLRTVLPAVLALLILAPPAAGGEPGWDKIRQEMTAVKSISADFLQTKNLKILSKPLASSGRFYYSAPDNLRWEYLSPVKSVLMMRAGAIRKHTFRNGRYETDLSSRLEPIRLVMEQISGFLNGSFTENPYFAARLAGTAPARIELTPRDREFAKIIRRIVITLSETPGVIRSVEILEPGDSSTLISFDRVRIGSPLPEKIFETVP